MKAFLLLAFVLLQFQDPRTVQTAPARQARAVQYQRGTVMPAPTEAIILTDEQLQQLRLAKAELRAAFADYQNAELRRALLIQQFREENNVPKDWVFVVETSQFLAPAKPPTMEKPK
jgi:hypothetical protein